MAHIVRRVRQAGTYFVTSRTWQSRALFQRPATAQILLEQLLDCRGRGFYNLHEFVIMPDHFHALLTPAAETTLEKAMQMIKGGSAHRIHQESGGKFPVWQSGFHDRWIRDQQEYEARAAYIRENPVTARLAGKPEDYAFSSACGRFAMDARSFRAGTSGAEAPMS